MFGGAQINQLIDIVSYSWETEDRSRGEAGAHRGNGETVRLCRRKGVVHRFHTGGAGHVFNDDCWIARKVFFH